MNKKDREELKSLLKENLPHLDNSDIKEIIDLIEDFSENIDEQKLLHYTDMLQVVIELREHLEAIEMPTTKDEIRLQEVKNLEFKLTEIVLNNRK